MLWYLANGSLNEYLKSQLQLQGQYYTKQVAQVTLANFSLDAGKGVFTGIRLANPSGYQSAEAVIIDKVTVELAPSNNIAQQTVSPLQKQQALVTQVKQLTIHQLTLNKELSGNKDNSFSSNLSLLLNQVKNQLAQDYPALYPEISAKYYAQKNPALNADRYAQSHPDAGPMIEAKKAQKSRSKVAAKIAIQQIVIKTLIINERDENSVLSSRQYTNISVPAIGVQPDMQGIETNQLGGEILLSLLSLGQ